MKLRTVALAVAVLAAVACMGDFDVKDDTVGIGAVLPPGRPAASAPPGGYTARDIARHNSEVSCWLTLHGKVYDVTAFLPFHPGGSAILQGCGKDATKLFETRPMGSGTAHSSDALETASRYYAGPLK